MSAWADGGGTFPVRSDSRGSYRVGEGEWAEGGVAVGRGDAGDDATERVAAGADDPETMGV